MSLFRIGSTWLIPLCLVSYINLGATALHAQVPEPSDSTVSLVVDFATVIHAEANISSIILGNADIADATLAGGQSIVVTGKKVGTTNLIVLDETGDIAMNLLVHVGARKPGTITVRRALNQRSYACTIFGCENNEQESFENAPQSPDD